MKTRSSSTEIHEVLRQFPYGVYAIGIRGDDGAANALIASWVIQCSFEPPLVLVAIRQDSCSFDLLEAGRAFSITLLDPHQSEIARELVKPAHRSGSKVDRLPHIDGEAGAPVLEDGLAYVECTVREMHRPGDHALVIGEVVGGAVRRSGDPLTCADLGWRYGG